MVRGVVEVDDDVDDRRVVEHTRSAFNSDSDQSLIAPAPSNGRYRSSRKPNSKTPPSCEEVFELRIPLGEHGSIVGPGMSLPTNQAD